MVRSSEAISASTKACWDDIRAKKLDLGYRQAERDRSTEDDECGLLCGSDGPKLQ